MKVVSTEGLTKLIQIIKSSCLTPADVIAGDEIVIDDTVTSASTNLVSSGAVYTSVSNKEAKGKMTIGGTENTVVSHNLVITDNGVTTTYTLLGI